MFTTAFAVVAQGIPVRFTARNANGAYHPFDTVRIENLSRGWTYSLAYPDTSIVLGSGSSEGIDRVVGHGELELKVYPNPFAGRTEAMLHLTEGGNVNMRIIRIDGTVISYYSGNLSAGEYRIGINMAKPQVAFLCIETGGQRHVAKLVNGTTGSADRIEVALIGGPKPQTKDDDQYDYEDGDTMRYTAILVANCTNIESESITEENDSDTTVILVFDDDHVVLPATEGFYENGSSHALFSVAADRKVRFSRGNLQYQASTDTWRFAEHQYEYIDSCNENISESYSGWIDLFGWGTSGWNSGAAAYQPWATSENNEDYVPNGNNDNDLAGEYANSDWGVYNAISNGGNQPGMWRTLTYNEMRYLIESRPNAVNKLGSATVNGMPGLVILPDDWNLPADLTFTSDMVTNGFESNIYSADQWTAMENAGALFLPAAGQRVGTELFENPEWSPINGGYWTSTHSNMDYMPGAYALWIAGNSVHCYNTRAARLEGISVRLIMDYLPAEPAVSTREVTGITNSFAIGGGNITFSGGEEVIARGVCWSTEHNPTIEDSHTSDGTGLGNFTSYLTDLTPSTTYYVRAYATNSVGTAYGREVEFTTERSEVMSLPTVVTFELNEITLSTAIGGGIVVDDGGDNVTLRGLCWSTLPSPTIEDVHTVEGNGIGEFVSTIIDLDPATTYHARAYAVNSVGVAYGEEVNFTTLNLPTVVTSVVSNITNFTATCGGVVTDDGGDYVTARGVCWNTVSSPTVNDNHTTNGSGIGEFTSNLSNLASATMYYVRAYATNSFGTTYGEERVFTSEELSVPTVETSVVSDITASTAICGGTVTDDGGDYVTARGVCWSTIPSPTINDNHTTNGSGMGNFTSNLSDLAPSTLYYVRAYATNSIGTSYGEERSFTIVIERPTVSTSSIRFIETTSVTCGGDVTSDGNAPVTERGVCWSTNNNPTISDNYTIDGNGTGTFTSNITGLTGGTTYYVRAFATNSMGTSYGGEVTFTTDVPLNMGFDEDGASTGLFSVSDTNQVKFSKGNLRYQASTNTWSFADNQYYYIGSSNTNISSTYSGWIDLFGWGTSGWNSGANAYQPWSSSTTSGDYISNNNLAGEYANADWGIYNAISNGGNQSGLWRTLSYDEWNYLLFSRDVEYRYAKATVNGINGIIIFPDNFTLPSGITVNNANANARFYVNTYNLEQWATLQSASCIFLPAAGYRNGTSGVGYPGNIGRYWSTTYNTSSPWHMLIYDNTVSMGYYSSYYGQSVRLVQDAE